MRKYNILLTVLSAILLLSGCSEENTFVFTGYESRNVDFVAINMSVKDDAGMMPDSALSVAYDGSYYEGEYEPKKFDIRVYNLFPESYGEDIRYITINVDHRNQLWAGGYSEIAFRFRPSCPEEKEARFTMPDGKVMVVSADNPECSWVLDYEAWNNIQDWSRNGYNLAVKAESEYEVNETVYRNIGYVLLQINEAEWLQYNAADGKWYENYWVDNPNLEIRGNVDFKVENLTVGNNEDVAHSYTYGGSYDVSAGSYRESKFMLDVYPLEGDNLDVPQQTEVRLEYYHHVWAGGNNELKFTFRPKNEWQKEAVFTMPDGKTFNVNASDSTFVWTLDHDVVAGDVEWYSHYGDRLLLVKAESSYEVNGIRYSDQGYVFITTGAGYWSNTLLQYNPANGRWYANDWITDPTLARIYVDYHKL